jgi:hypothetical protein
MRARVFWALAAGIWYGAIWITHRTGLADLEAVSSESLRLAYGAGFFVFGVLLLGAVARWWQNGSPALWRPVMLSVGSLAAALELALWSRPAGGPLLDQWMAALLGLVAVAILARVVPDRVTRLWLGLDRRARTTPD